MRIISRGITASAGPIGIGAGSYGACGCLPSERQRKGLLMKKPLMAAALAASSIAVAPLSHADKGENDFLQDVANTGIPVNSHTLNAGYQVCMDVASGTSPTLEAGLISTKNHLDQDRAGRFVKAALQDLCQGVTP